MVDDEIVFFYENYAVFYFKTQKALKSHEKKNIENSLLVNTKQTSMSKICKDIERNTDNYNTYREYRKELMNDDKAYLQGKIISNKNFSMKCDNGCIAVI